MGAVHSTSAGRDARLTTHEGKSLANECRASRATALRRAGDDSQSGAGGFGRTVAAKHRFKRLKKGTPAREHGGDVLRRFGVARRQGIDRTASWVFNEGGGSVAPISTGSP
jgi:hypothetical protein